MAKEKLFRLCLVLILTCLFISIVINAMKKLMNEETIFMSREMQGGGRFPSFTICPSRLEWSIGPNNLQNMTFENLKDLMEQSQKYIGANLTINDLTVDLTKNESLKEHFGVNFEDVWSFSPKMDHTPPYLLSMCASINIPIDEIQSDELAVLFLGIQDLGNQRHDYFYYVEKVEPKQSRHNSQFDWGNSIELITPGSNRIRHLSMIQTHRIKTREYDCDETNSQSCFAYINQWTIERLQCKPFWIDSNLTECTGHEKLTEFLKLRQQFVTNFSMPAQCALPNCLTKTWNLASDETLFSSNETTTLIYFIPMRSKVLFKNEVRIYSAPNFVADFGGYLGLFLGGSILSFYDTFFETICNKCSKKS